MNKFLLNSLFVATALSVPMSSYAQDENPDPDLTIGFSILSPSSVAFDQAPTEFTLNFNGAGVNVLSITDNTDFQTQSNVGGDPTFTGKYAYVEYVLNDVTMQSAPLTSYIEDGVVILSVDYSKTPQMEALLNSEGFYNLNLVVPEGLFTVRAVNIVNSTNDYSSLGITNTYVHAGKAELVNISSNPVSGSRIEKVSSFDLSFSIPQDIIDNCTWVNMVNGDPVVFTRFEGDSSWTENGMGTLSIDENDIKSAQLKVRPSMSTKGQYRIDIPTGAFAMTGKAADGTEYSYITSAASFRFAIGEDVEIGGLPKEDIFAMVTPPEGDVNLTNYPSGVEYLQLIFKEIPALNRNIGKNIKLYYNDGETPLREVNPLNETIFRLQTQGVSNEYGHIVNLWFDYGESNFDAPGNYTVVFPAGLFLFGETQEPSAEFTLNFNIAKTLTYAIYPKNQTTVDDIETITINFNTASSVTASENAEKLIYISSLSTSPVYPKIDIDGKVVRLNFEKITENHVYTLNIPAGVFNAVIDNEILPNQPMEFIYTVSLLPIPEIIPAQGILPSNTVYDFTLDLGEDAEITGIIDNGYNRLLRLDDNGEIIYVPVVSYYKYEEPENALGSSLVTLIPKNETPLTLSPGNYVLITTRYLYTLKGGDTAGEFFYYFTVLPDLPVLPQPQITPWDNVNSASHFSLALEDSEIISSISDNFSYIYPKHEDGTLGEAAGKYFASKGEKSNMVDLIGLDVANLTPGIYTIVTPKALFRTSSAVADSYNFDIYFGVSSVISTATENETFSVFTLDGIRIMNNAPAAELENLSAGFYIINGKKVIIK